MQRQMARDITRLSVLDVISQQFKKKKCYRNLIWNQRIKHGKQIHFQNFSVSAHIVKLSFT